jgi:hypothetical protein
MPVSTDREVIYLRQMWPQPLLRSWVRPAGDLRWEMLFATLDTQIKWSILTGISV